MSGRGNGRALGGRERRGKKKEESEGKTELKLNPFSTPRHSAVPLPLPLHPPSYCQGLRASLNF